MPAFLSNIESFRGTGIKNEQGKGLEEFLENYDANKFENPSVTADILVFKYNSKRDDINITNGLKLLMIQRKNHPSIGYWALPGGFVDMREDIEVAAKRELYEETGLEGIEVSQLYCWGNYERDPRTRIITVSYLAMIEQNMEVKAGDDAADALWFDVKLTKMKSSFSEDKIQTDEFKIELHNKEKELSIYAEVIREQSKQNIFNEPKYKVIQTHKVAFDHPCFILQALDKIKLITNRN